MGLCFLFKEVSMTINFGDLRRGVAIEVDGQPYEVVDYERHKMQQRAPVTRLKLRNLRDGKVIERTFQSYTTEFSLAQVDTRPAQYLYTDGRFYYVMDMESYDQYQLTKEQLGDAVNYLKEETVVDVMFYNESVINVHLPTFVELEVVEAPPGFKGDTAQGGTKPATLETGVVIQVPLFVNSGQRVKVDTRNGEYIERAG
jgi:elongation factor P